MTETTRLFAADAQDMNGAGLPQWSRDARRIADPSLPCCLIVDLNADATTTDPIIEFEDRVLRRLGGSLRHPPKLEPGWENADHLNDLVQTGRSLLASATPPVEALGIDDPRAGLLISFWQRVIGKRLPIVIAIAPPTQSATALAANMHWTVAQALARYERYFRIATQTAYRATTFVLDVDRKGLSEKRAERLGAFCDAIGASSDYGMSDIANRFASQRANEAEELVIAPIEALYDTITSRHESLTLAERIVGSESSWTAALLTAERDLEQVVSGLDWAAKRIEPLMRATPQTIVTTKQDSGNQESEQELEQTEVKESEPYPLNASEDRRSYHRWLRARHDRVVVGGAEEQPLKKARTRAPRRGKQPLVSIVVPVWRTPLWALERCVSSVLAQSVGDWELCLCDDASGDEELTNYLKSLHRVDRRISVCALKENGGISAATNAAIANASGRFIAFLDHDDELAPNALEEVAKAIAAAPDADVLYSDEDKIDASGERFDPLFKPDWSPDLLLSFAYICHLTVVRQDLVAELGGLRTEFDGSQDYDLSLRATEHAKCIVHIPEVLYHWRTLPGSAASDSPGAVAKPWAYEAGRRAIEDALSRRGEAAEVAADDKFPGRYHVRRAITSRPLVSIIIPFRDEPALLATCANSLRENPGYDRIELVLVDNGSELPETAALLDRLAGPDVKIVSAPGPFNWAAINNSATKIARGEMLLFSNNDIEARAPRWLDALLGHALRPEVGAVGARLIYPDGAIQHAGVVIGLGGIAGHPLRGLPGWHPGYNSMAIQTRNCSVVTGACMMTRRDVFESVGGFNELLPVAFNDVDYCLKLREKDYLIVYSPLAELIHHESRSRGHTDDLVESRRIVNRWSDAIAAGDPYMNTHLSHWRYWCPLSTAQEDDRWKTYLETSVLTQASSSST